MTVGRIREIITHHIYLPTPPLSSASEVVPYAMIDFGCALTLLLAALAVYAGESQSYLLERPDLGSRHAAAA
ncbi:hypothetical protein BH23GEM8_BH23GEM8_23360 [soil metagenome]